MGVPVYAVRYATIDDFTTSGLPNGALAAIDKQTWQKALDRASAYANSFIGDKYALPLVSPYDPALVDAVCQVAAWRLLCLRGFNPNNPGDQVVRQGWEDATAWLTRVANGQASITVVQAVPPSYQPDTFSNQPRGYGDLAGNSTVFPGVPGSGNWGT